MILLADIHRAVAHAYRLSRDELRVCSDRNERGYPKRRGSRVAIEARWVAIYLSRRLTERSLWTIATSLGYRDHAIANWSEDRVVQRLGFEPRLRTRMADALGRLGIAEPDSVIAAAPLGYLKRLRRSRARSSPACPQQKTNEIQP